jgi:hypothetical protein
MRTRIFLYLAPLLPLQGASQSIHLYAHAGLAHRVLSRRNIESSTFAATRSHEGPSCSYSYGTIVGFTGTLKKFAVGAQFSNNAILSKTVAYLPVPLPLVDSQFRGYMVRYREEMLDLPVLYKCQGDASRKFCYSLMFGVTPSIRLRYRQDLQSVRVPDVNPNGGQTNGIWGARSEAENRAFAQLKCIAISGVDYRLSQTFAIVASLHFSYNLGKAYSSILTDGFLKYEAYQERVGGHMLTASGGIGLKVTPQR